MRFSPEETAEIDRLKVLWGKSSRAEVVRALIGLGERFPDMRVPSVRLAQLIEEVRAEPAPVRGSYNRTHNRHNR